MSIFEGDMTGEGVIEKGGRPVEELTQEELPHLYVEGVDSVSAYGEVTKAPVIEKDQLVKLRASEIGKYSINGGLAAFVNESGERAVCAAIPANIDILESKGFKPGFITVPFSSGDHPVDEQIKEEVDKYRAITREYLYARDNAESIEQQLSIWRDLFASDEPVDAQKIRLEIIHQPDQRYQTTRHHETIQITENKAKNIYELNGTRFSFVGREETIELPSNIEVHRLTINDVLQLAQKVYGESYIFSQTADLASSGRMESLIDGLTACTKAHLYDSTLKGPDPDGIYVFLDALGGDLQAQIEVVDRVGRLIDHDKHLTEARKATTPSEVSSETTKVSELAAVHITSFEPIRDGEGVMVDTIYNASKAESFRNTVHFSMNFPTPQAINDYSPDGTDRDLAPYVVVTNTQDILDANGSPSTYSGVDTIWELNPGQKLKLPNAILVKPGSVEIGNLIQDRGNEITYGVQNIREAFRQVSMYFFQEKRSNDFYSQLKTSLDYSFYDDNDLRSIWENICQTNIKQQQVHPAQTLSTMLKQSQSFDNDLAKYIDETNPGLPQDQIGKLVSRIDSIFEKFTHYSVRQMAAEYAIKKLGKEVKRPGKYSWNNYHTFSKEDAIIANELGSQLGVHSDTSEYALEEDINSAMHQKARGQEFATDAIEKDVKYLNPPTRRCLMEMGILS